MDTFNTIASNLQSGLLAATALLAVFAAATLCVAVHLKHRSEKPAHTQTP
ncbi:MAG TPA: hypothetical protein VFQ88_03000 [Nevskiaceae bacterium]|nr:hypothetical protein [Nevskiaceae bacterium]